MVHRRQTIVHFYRIYWAADRYYGDKVILLWIKWIHLL